MLATIKNKVKMTFDYAKQPNILAISINLRKVIESFISNHSSYPQKISLGLSFKLQK